VTPNEMGAAWLHERAAELRKQAASTARIQGVHKEMSAKVAAAYRRAAAVLEDAAIELETENKGEGT
jgi:hypothetical protein